MTSCRITRQLAIRAAKFGPEADFEFEAVDRNSNGIRNASISTERGSFEGATRIPLHAPSFLFNDLAFLWIPRKPVKFLALLFSIPTAPTNFLMLLTLVANSLCQGDGKRTIREPEIQRETVLKPSIDLDGK